MHIYQASWRARNPSMKRKMCTFPGQSMRLVGDYACWPENVQNPIKICTFPNVYWQLGILTMKSAQFPLHERIMGRIQCHTKAMFHQPKLFRLPDKTISSTPAQCSGCASPDHPKQNWGGYGGRKCWWGELVGFTALAFLSAATQMNLTLCEHSP